MTKTPSVFTTTPQAPDFAAAGKAWAGLIESGLAASRAVAEQAMTPGALPYDPAKTAEVMSAVGLSLWSNPARLAEAQMEGWRAWAELCQNTARRALGDEISPVAEPARTDRRFRDADWNAPGFDFAKQGYLLAAQWLEALIGGADLDPDTKTRAAFLLRQFITAASPTNSPLTNPVVVRRTLETGGLNLLTGASNLLADVARGEGLVQRRAQDDFELGRTIAATPGAVVYQNDLMQLIQYAPATETVARRPVLMIPPMVNKYYLFDLQPQTSFLKWLVDQGHTVFVISWANPDENHRDKDLTAFVKEGAVEALRAVEQATGEREVDVIGFCLGGTLTSITLGYLQAIGDAGRVASATLIAALTDFGDLGEWSVFLGEDEVETFAEYLAEKGYVEGHDLARLFSVVRANDLVWGPFVTHYLLGDEAPTSDLLWWFFDTARMPQGLLDTYLRQVIRDNGLTKAGGVVIDGEPIDLAKVKTPIRIIAMKDDHVSGWEATYRGASQFGGPVSYLLGGSGHNAGVINPPHANKHGYWTNAKTPKTAQA
ncbi:MAG: PHA/PHB synthase family protein, partial [Caulobacteraceae bacterium]